MARHAAPHLPEDILGVVSRNLGEEDKKRMRLASRSCCRVVGESVIHIQESTTGMHAPVSFPRFTGLESVIFTSTAFLGQQGELVKTCPMLQHVTLALDRLTYGAPAPLEAHLPPLRARSLTSERMCRKGDVDDIGGRLAGYAHTVSITVDRLCGYDPIVHLSLPCRLLVLDVHTYSSCYPSIVSSKVTHLSVRLASPDLHDPLVIKRVEAFAAASPALSCLYVSSFGSPKQDCTLGHSFAGLQVIKLRDVSLPRGLATFSSMRLLRQLSLTSVWFDSGSGPAPAPALPPSLTHLRITSEDKLPDFETPPFLRHLALAGSMFNTDSASRVTIASTLITHLYLSSVNALASGAGALLGLTSLRMFYLDCVAGPLYRDVVGPMWNALASLQKVTLSVTAGNSWDWDISTLEHVIEQRLDMVTAGGQIASGQHLTQPVWGMRGSMGTVGRVSRHGREALLAFERIQVRHDPAGCNLHQHGSRRQMLLLSVDFSLCSG